MAEPRRVQLTTISGNVPLPPAAPKPALIAKPAIPTVESGERGERGESGERGERGESGHTGAAAPTPTVRFHIPLFEPDERRCSEFWYPELLSNKQSVPEREPGLPGCLAEEDGDEKELEAIARKFEEKYGDGGKKKRDRIQDLVDIGHGYDDEDSFIDNSEAYDEFVPSSLTTQHGGFYVNSGTLQFRQNSDTDTDNDFTTEMTAPKSAKEGRLSLKKRKLKEGGEEKPREKKKRREEESGQVKRREEEREEQNGQKPSEESHTGGGEEKAMMTMKKKKQPAGPLSVTDMLRKFRKQKERERLRRENEQTRREAAAGGERSGHTPGVGLSIGGDLLRTPLGPADAAGGGLGLADPLLSLIDLTNDNALLQAAGTVDFLEDLDSLLDATAEDPPRQEVTPDPSTQVQGHAPKLPTQSQTEPVTLPKTKCLRMAIPQNQAQNQAQLQTSALTVSEADFQPYQTTLPSDGPVAKTHPQAPPPSVPQPLPEGLPPALGRSIAHLALAAQGFVGEHKVKFFTPEVNNILLDVELQSRDLGVQVRSKVYTHLASILPCSRDTLLKRAKKLLHAQEEPLQKLSEAIARAMPEQISRYHDDCQAHAQARVAKVAEEEREREQREEEKEREQNGGGTEEEGEEEERKSGKRVWGPRKTFRWNDEIRECLYWVVRVKIESYQLDRERDQNQIQNQRMEEHLKTFLNDQVKPLWPKGWMQPRVLLKESRRVLNEGSNTVKRKVKTEGRRSSLVGAPTPPDTSTRPVDPQAFPGPLAPNGAPLLGSGVGPAASPLGLDASLNEGASPVFVDTPPGAVWVEVAAAAVEPRPSLCVLVEQALARDRLIEKKLLAAVTSDLLPQQRGRSLGLLSPPPPPPPPQSSPVLPHFLHGLTHDGSLVLGDGSSSQRKLY